MSNEGSLTVLAVVGLVFAVPSCMAVSGCQEDYSTGKRIGSVVKFSQKGIIRKSWEGTLHLGSTRDAATGANSWDFSVTDPEAVRQVQTAFEVGDPVEILYHEWLVAPWWIDSKHVVTQIQRPEGK